MARTTWLGILGSLLLLAGCDEDPALEDAGGAVVGLDASGSVPLPDATLPGADSSVTQPLGDTGTITPIPNDASVPMSDTGIALPDGQVAAPDAQTGDGAVSPGDASTGGFPPVTDTGAKGPYTATTIMETGPGMGYTLFHPVELAPGGALNPIVSWGNGGFTTPDFYPLLPHLASHGFVVIASNNAFLGGDDVRAGIDWIVEQNETASSPFYKKLDVRNVSGVGYSNGGLGTLAVADDPRFKTIVIISGANTTAEARTQNMPKLRTPTAYLCTEDEASRGNCAGDYAAATVPAFFGVIKGSDHFAVVFDSAVIDLLNISTTAWLRWQQMGDQSFKAKFVGSGCGLCSDSKWTVEQKNLQ